MTRAWRDGAKHWAYRVADFPNAVQIASREDDPEPGRSADEWPYPTEYITYEAGAGMADDIRAAAGDVDPDAPVIIEEEVISGGYSEYTQENDYPFTVKIGEWEREFETIPALFRWLDERDTK